MEKKKISNDQLRDVYSGDGGWSERRFKEIMEARLAVWKECLNEAKKAHPQAPPDELIQEADLKCINRGEAPPHWRKWVLCYECGPQPVFGPPDEHGKMEEVQACPWCFTDMGCFYSKNPKLRFWDVPKLRDAI